MSIIARTAPTVKPTPTRSTVVLFDATDRTTVSRDFARGILASRPTTRLSCTIADLQEMAQVFGELSDARDAMSDSEYDRLAAESMTLGGLEHGYLIPADVAESIAATSLVGGIASADEYDGMDAIDVYRANLRKPFSITREEAAKRLGGAWGRHAIGL